MDKMSDRITIDIVKFNDSHLEQIIQLFRETVHSINRQHYDQQQLDVWAPENIDRKQWHERLIGNISYVALTEEEVVGFAELTLAGCVHTLYVHKDRQRMKIGHHLLKQLEKEASHLNITTLTTEASITAKPFFIRHGFAVLKEQRKQHKGLVFVNYIMEKKQT